jgi:hypothetical protein
MFKKLSLILCTALFAQQSYATDVALGAGLSTLGFGSTRYVCCQSLC